MSATTTYPHITKIEGEPARLTRVPRVRVAQIVMDWMAHGWTAEEMCRQHPYLTPAEAHSAMAYYYDHSDEVEEEIRQETDVLGRPASRSPFHARMKAFHPPFAELGRASLIITSRTGRMPVSRIASPVSSALK